MELVYEAKPALDALGDARLVIVDTETSSKFPHRDGKVLAGVGVKPFDGPSFYMPVRHKNGSRNASLRAMRELMEGLRGLTLIFHNPKFDLAVLFNDGVDLLDEDVLDTVVMTRLTYEDELNYELKVLGKRFVKPDAGEHEKNLKTLMKERGWTTYDQVPAELILAYVDEDLELPEGLYKLTMPLIKRRGLEPLLELEKKVMRALFYMEQRGFLMDRGYITDEHRDINALIAERKAALFKTTGEALRDRASALDATDTVERERTAAALELFESEGKKGKERDTFNHNSAPELKKIFHGLGIHSPVMTSGGKKKKQPQESWAKTALAEIDHPMTDMVVELRGAENIEHYYSGFLELMGEDDVIHCSVHQAGARTGRCSCREPNLQNIPKFAGFRGSRGSSGVASMKRLQRRDTDDASGFEMDEEAAAKFASELEGELVGKVRGAFIARPDRFLLFCDWSQIEFRIFADYVGEEAMLRVFELGLDFHKLTAQAAYGAPPAEPGTALYKWWRGMGKDLNFGLIFGMGIALLATKIGKSTDEAREFMDRYFGRFKGARKFIDNITGSFDSLGVCMDPERVRVHRRRGGRELGWVRNMWGRRRYLTKEMVYKAVNFLVQGTAADLMKDVLVRIHEELWNKFETRLLLTVHDELIFEVPYEEAEAVIPIIVREMNTCPRLKIKPVVDVDWSPTRWSEKQSLACETCGGDGQLVGADEDALIAALYRNDSKTLDSVEVTTCADCGGDGYDLSLIEKVAA